MTRGAAPPRPIGSPYDRFDEWCTRHPRIVLAACGAVCFALGRLTPDAGRHATALHAVARTCCYGVILTAALSGEARFMNRTLYRDARRGRCDVFAPRVTMRATRDAEHWEGRDTGGTLHIGGVLLALLGSLLFGLLVVALGEAFFRSAVDSAEYLSASDAALATGIRWGARIVAGSAVLACVAAPCVGALHWVTARRRLEREHLADIRTLIAAVGLPASTTPIQHDGAASEIGHPSRTTSAAPVRAASSSAGLVIEQASALADVGALRRSHSVRHAVPADLHSNPAQQTR